MNRTTSLFANPSFFRGMASVLDIGGTLNVYNASDGPEEADARAIYSDWVTVGEDMYFAIHEWEEEYEEATR